MRYVLLTLFAMTVMTTQAQLNSKQSTVYIHNRSPSFKARFLQFMMWVINIKDRTEKRIVTKNFVQQPDELPKAIQEKAQVSLEEFKNRNLWIFKPNRQTKGKAILYIHGGAFITSLTKYDWSFIEKLISETQATVIVPDYPLAPASDYRDVYDYFDSLYTRVLSDFSHERIIFLGNSAGGGFALGFAQKLRNENRPQPSQIVLVSPWLDITMSNPDIREVDKRDKALGIKGLQMAGALYAGATDAKDYQVSPLYGEFSGLGRISIFIGTHDLFIADARKLRDILDNAGIESNYFEYPKMFHVWVAVTDLKESQHAIQQISWLISSFTK
jgi:acetyl esterase/lipase